MHELLCDGIRRQVLVRPSDGAEVPVLRPDGRVDWPALQGIAAEIGWRPSDLWSSGMWELFAHVEAWHRTHPARRRRAANGRDAAARVLAEIYPHGIPDQATVANKALCRAVADRLPPGAASDVTILRAAGRRR
jgi:hypothetical protein